LSFVDLVPYCLTDRMFFDSPDHLRDSDRCFPLAVASPPGGWSKTFFGLSVALRHISTILPAQGWKIHISTIIDNTQPVICIIYNYCISHHIPFKFVRSIDAYRMMNSKNWDRSSSGKTITIYPKDDAELTSIITDLSIQLVGFDGPYILSDLRIAKGPLYVRYGAFVEQIHKNTHGESVLGIRSPTGSIIADSRAPIFTIPDFVEPPDVIKPYISARHDFTDSFSYEITHALQFSNAGGVYLGLNKYTERNVVLKEARPFAGIDDNNLDAVARLTRERDVLFALNGLACVPQLIEFTQQWEHFYLIEEFVSGPTLLDAIIYRYPFVSIDPPEERIRLYYDWVTATISALTASLNEIHARGVFICDLHPSNIIVSEDNRLVIIDLECAAFNIDERPALRTPGFSAPSDINTKARDFYALACIHLMMLLPVAPIAGLCPAKHKILVKTACDLFSINIDKQHMLEADLLIGEVEHFDDGAKIFYEGIADWNTLKTALTSSIIISATPERADRLFPGDPLTFQTDGISLAYGAAGVLLALTVCTADIPDSFVNWLITKVHNVAATSAIGLYDGLHGVAYVLERLGRREAAVDCLQLAISREMPLSPSLFSGSSGIALNLLFFSNITGEYRLFELAKTIIDNLVMAAEKNDLFKENTPGLFYGRSGVALAFIRFFEETGDTAYINAARRLLYEDMENCEILNDGSYQLKDGQRRLLYLDGGSIGIGFVLRKFLEHQSDASMRAALSSIKISCQIPFVLQSGLFQGRAGLVAFLAHQTKIASDPALEAQLRRFSWHAIWDGRLYFPGRGLMKCSDDLATGTAGVILALHSACSNERLQLPFF
jgi:tRNA A-37 threonylcarbamoyl transferase component Bud32